MLTWWRRKPGRVRLAIGLIIFVMVGYPSTAVADLLGIPLFQQVMLFLSWLAPAVSAVDVLFTAQVHEQQDQGEQPTP
jgi:hypothetical protein